LHSGVRALDSAPDEPATQENKVIREPGGDKHVNIIFVKTPSQVSSSQTEVILPEQDEHKNLVYVLLKKGEATSNVDIRRSSAPRQQKPEVYFIRYGDQQQQQQFTATATSTLNWRGDVDWNVSRMWTTPEEAATAESTATRSIPPPSSWRTTSTLLPQHNPPSSSVNDLILVMVIIIISSIIMVS
jgi:hypothetical protein